MNWASRFRHVPDAARSLLISLLIMISSLSDQTLAQAGVDVWRGKVAAAASHQGENTVCDLFRVPASRVKIAQKALSQQRAEYALGSTLAADVEQHSELISDASIVQYVNQFERALISGSQLPGCFVVKVVSDPEPNAYSLPGGFIYITTGLIDLIENEGQLVAALTHETAHVTARHQTRLDTQLRLGRRLTLVGGPVGYALRRYLGPLLTSKLVRNEEFEADRLGLQYTMASGYDPSEFPRLLRIAFSQEEEDEAFVQRFYNTHPSTNARIKRLQKATPLSIAPQTRYIVNSSEFSEMRMRLIDVWPHRETRR